MKNLTQSQMNHAVKFLAWNGKMFYGIMKKRGENPAQVFDENGKFVTDGTTIEGIGSWLTIPSPTYEDIQKMGGKEKYFAKYNVLRGAFKIHII